ncbi:MAG: S-layer homology domain-containing protein [Cyanobacteriota bacterium]
MKKKLRKNQSANIKIMTLSIILCATLCCSAFASDSKQDDLVTENASILDKMVTQHIIPDMNTEFTENTNINEKKVYSDVVNNTWAYEALDELTNKYGVLVGMPDGTFQGERSATRYEMAQALVKTINKIETDQLKLSAIEEAAIKSLKSEFDKEIIALAARIEINETRISELQTKENVIMETLSADIEKLEKRHYFVPEIKLRYGFGDYENNEGTHASARLRLTSVTKLNKDTLAVIRLHAETANLINHSEKNNDIADADLTLAYIKTGALTRWVPEKAGKAIFMCGIMPPNWLFYANNYTANVDMRAFNDSNFTFSPFSTQVNAFSREVASGRRMSIGGEYIKEFPRYHAKIQASALRGSGGSIDIPGLDISSSGDEPTFYSLSAETDLPTKKIPLNFKVSHLYSFNDAGTDKRTYSIGGRLGTKIENFGALKAAVIGHNGTVPPRLLGGTGGQGFTYQVAFNPASHIFGNLFGNPDEITHRVPNNIPGKTELGASFSNFHNDQDESIRVVEVYLARYFAKNIFGKILFSHANPNVRTRGLSARNYLLLETVFNL